MPNTPAGMRQCPTRADGTHALFAHVIAPSTCQERQRGFYHKCPTCSFCNPRARSEPAAKGLNGHALPAVPKLPPLEVHASNGVNGIASKVRVEAPPLERVVPLMPDVPVGAAEASLG
jgi:hypothetical protein